MMGLIFIVTITVLQVQMRVSTCFFFTCDICVVVHAGRRISPLTDMKKKY
jgi:hypothetical protein